MKEVLQLTEAVHNDKETWVPGITFHVMTNKIIHFREQYAHERDYSSGNYTLILLQDSNIIRVKETPSQIYGQIIGVLP